MEAGKDGAVVERLLRDPSLRARLNDPAAFFEALQAAGHCLEQPDIREHADRLLGILIAQQASRFLSTAWPVLFQQLRDTTNVAVKLCIIRHFSNICGRIGPQERKSAFHIFSEEADRLFADVQVVTDHSFVENLTTIIKVCARHADRAFCVNLFTTILNRINSWERKDALRACCEIACLFPIYSDTCGTVTDNLHHAEETFPTDKYALLLDCTARALLDYRDELADAATCSQWATTLWTHTQCLLHDTLFAEPPLYAAIPPAIASYTRLKSNWPQLCPNGPRLARGAAAHNNDSDGSEEEHLARRALALLAQPALKRLVVPSLLDLLRNVAPIASRDCSATDAPQLLWSFVDKDDPLVRAAAIEVIAKMTLNGVDCASASAAAVTQLDRLHQLLDQYAAERCTYTVNALLHLFAAHLRSGDWIATHTTFEIVQSILDKYFLFHEQLRANASVQVAVLEFIDAAPAVSRQMLHFIVNACYRVDTEVVQACAQKCLLALLYFVPLNQSVFHPNTLTRSNAVENVAMNADWASVQKSLLTPMHVVNNFCCILSFIQTEFLSCGESELSYEKKVKRLTEHVQFLLRHYLSHFQPTTRSDDARVAAALADLALYLHDLVFSDENFPVDVLSEMMHTATLCLNATVNASGSPLTGNFFLFQRLISRSWNILQRCCSYLDPASTPKLHSVSNVFFGFEELSFNMERAIANAAEVALTNAKKYNGSSLYELIQSTAELFAFCLRQSTAFPLFTDNLLYLYPLVGGSLHALTAFDPKAVLRIFSALAETCVRSSLVWDTDLVETTRRRQEMMTAMKDILLGNLMFDVQENVHEAVQSLCALAVLDSDTTAGDISSLDSSAASFSRFYINFDADLSVFQFFKAVAVDPAYYVPVYGTSVIEPALQFIAVVLRHVPSHILSDDQDVLSGDNLDTMQRLVANFLQEDDGALNRCQRYLDDIQSQIFSFPAANSTRKLSSSTEINVPALVALLDTREDAETFFSTLESLSDFYEASTAGAREEVLCILTRTPSTTRLACAAALDSRYVKNAIAACHAAHSSTRAYILDFLALLAPHMTVSFPADPLQRTPTTLPCSAPAKTDDSCRTVEDLLTTAAALPLPFPYVLSATSDDALFSAFCHNSLSTSEYLHWLFRTTGRCSALVTSLCERELLDTVDEQAIIQLARCLSTHPAVNCGAVTAPVAAKMMAQLWRVAARMKYHTALMKYSVIIVLAWLVSALEESVDAFVISALGGSSPTKNPVDVDTFFALVKVCLCLPHTTSISEIPTIIADQTVQFISGSFTTCDAAVVLCLCKVFRTPVLAATLARYDDDGDHLRLFAFLTAMSQMGGLTRAALREINARFTPLLLSAFRGDGDQEAHSMNLLFTAVTLLNFFTNTAAEPANFFFPHCGFSHAAKDYDCTALRRHTPKDARFARRFIESQLLEPVAAQQSWCTRDHFWNLHTRSLLPPVMCAHINGADDQRALTDDDMLLQNSFLHVYVRCVSQALQHVNDMSPFAVSTVFSTVGVLIGHGVFSERRTWNASSRRELREAIKEWATMHAIISPWLAKDTSRHGNILMPHIGPFPDSYRPLLFYDAPALLSAASVICAQPDVSETNDTATTRTEFSELTHGQVARKLLNADLVTYIIFVLAAASAPAPVSAVARRTAGGPPPPAATSTSGNTRKDEVRTEWSIPAIVSNRLIKDLVAISYAGQLGLAFCVRSLLHTSINVTVSKRQKGETTDKILALTKLTEAAFSDSLCQSERAFTVYYANYLLQCVLAVSQPGEPQWETIRILLSDVLGTSTTHVDQATLSTHEPHSDHPHSHGYHTFPVARPTLFAFQRRDATRQAGGEQGPRQDAVHTQYEGEWRSLASLSSVLMFIACSASSPRTRAPMQTDSAIAMMERMRYYATAGQWSSTSFFLATQVVALNRLSGKTVLQLALNHSSFSARSRLCLTQSLCHIARCFAPAEPSSSGVSRNTSVNRDAVLTQSLTFLIKTLPPHTWADEQRCGWTICLVLATLVACTAPPPTENSDCNKTAALLKLLVYHTRHAVELARLLLLHLSCTTDSTRDIANTLLSMVAEELEQSDGAEMAGMRRVLTKIHFFPPRSYLNS